MARARTLQEKEAAARQRECFDKVRTHIRMGDWRSALDSQVTSKGSVWDLHGLMCTCDPPCRPRGG